MTKRKENLPEPLILALADPIRQAKLRTICERLRELDRHSKPHDYTLDKDVSWLDYVYYGASGIKLSAIAEVFKV